SPLGNPGHNVRNRAQGAGGIPTIRPGWRRKHPVEQCGRQFVRSAVRTIAQAAECFGIVKDADDALLFVNGWQWYSQGCHLLSIDVGLSDGPRVGFELAPVVLSLQEQPDESWQSDGAVDLEADQVPGVDCLPR